MFDGEWLLDANDGVEGFDETMDHIGMREEDKEKYRKQNITNKLKELDDETFESVLDIEGLETKVYRFQLGSTFTATTPSGRNVKMTITRAQNKLIEEAEMEGINTITITEKVVNGDVMTVTAKSKDHKPGDPVMSYTMKRCSL